MSIALQKGGCKDGEADLQRTLIDFSKTAGGDYDQARICREVGVAVYDGMSQCIFGDYVPGVSSLSEIGFTSLEEVMHSATCSRKPSSMLCINWRRRPL
ncbi:hypothetical protein Aduo_018333 [Ancylostoma duodenale]